MQRPVSKPVQPLRKPAQKPADSRARILTQASARAPSRKPGRGWLMPVLIVACVGVFAVCTVLLIQYYSSLALSREAAQQLGDIYEAAVLSASEAPTALPTPEPTPAPTAPPQETAGNASETPTPQPTATELWPRVYASNPKLKVSSVFDDLQSRNRDIIAWLKIDSELDEAVVQRDNTYYLTHNALGQESVTGALFLDETCDLIHVPTQMVIYGHNMKTGAMFGVLKKYETKGASYYKEHAYIDFNTLYENGRYVIFAVCEVDVRQGQPYYLPFWFYQRFSDEKQFMDYVASARAYSQYFCAVDVAPGDRLLTLSTCTGTDDNKRLLVMARKVRDGEDLLALNMAVLSTYDK